MQQSCQRISIACDDVASFEKTSLLAMDVAGMHNATELKI